MVQFDVKIFNFYCNFVVKIDENCYALLNFWHFSASVSW